MKALLLRRGWLALAAGLLVALAGCAGNGSDDGEQAAADENGSAEAAAEAPADAVTITYSNWQFAEPGRGEAIQAIIDDFNSSQSEVFVEAVEIPFPRYAETITTQIGGGGGPDVVNLDEDTFHLAVDSGWLADITDLVSFEGELSATAQVGFDGDRRVAIPWEGINYALIINQALLDEAGLDVPQTFDEFLAAAEAITDGGTFGFAMRHTMDEEGGWWYDATNWVYGFCGEWTDADGNPTVNRSENVAAMEAYVDLIEAEVIPVGADAATYRRMGWEGLIGMMIDNSSVPGIFINENPDIADDLTFANVPFECPDNIEISIFTGVNANSDHPEEAARFVEYLLEPATQEQLQIALGGSAVARDLQPADELVEDRPWLPVYADAAPHGRPMPPQGQELNTAEIRSAILSRIDMAIAGEMTIQEALDAAQAEVEEIVSR